MWFQQDKKKWKKNEQNEKKEQNEKEKEYGIKPKPRDIINKPVSFIILSSSVKLVIGWTLVEYVLLLGFTARQIYYDKKSSQNEYYLPIKNTSSTKKWTTANFRGTLDNFNRFRDTFMTAKSVRWIFMCKNKISSK